MQRTLLLVPKSIFHQRVALREIQTLRGVTPFGTYGAFSACPDDLFFPIGGGTFTPTFRFRASAEQGGTRRRSKRLTEGLASETVEELLLLYMIRPSLTFSVRRARA